MRNCTRSRPTENNALGARSLQAPPAYASGGYMGSDASSSTYLGARTCSPCPFNGSPLLPYDAQFSGVSGYNYNYGNRLSVGGPHGALHMSGLPPYSGGSMLGTGGMYNVPSLIDQYGRVMPMGSGVMESKSEIPTSSKLEVPEGSWICEKCNNINYPFRTKCNRKNCDAERPAETNKGTEITSEDDRVLEQFGYISQYDSSRMLTEEQSETGHKDSTFARSSSLDPNGSCYEPADRQVISWLLNSIHHSLNQGLLFLNNAKEMWNKIEKVSKRNHVARIFELREEIRLCNQGEMSFTQYYASLCKLWEELMFYRPMPSCCPKGALDQRKRAEEDRILDLLSGLNAKHSYIKDQILRRTTLPSLCEVYLMLLNEEHPDKQYDCLMHPSMIDSDWSRPDAASQSQVRECCTCQCAFHGDFSISGGSEEQKCAHCEQLGHQEDIRGHLCCHPPYYPSTNAKSRVAEESDCTQDSCVSIKTAESPSLQSDTRIDDIECMLQHLNCI
ncbi:hypothetical protein Taro_043272 [Colocasia esculenta]|uniref:RanBP2-type domain-containing protein n=1 Tax=Colocasia esculenta TaxID=4460 RepID=A0A843X3V4_COLES|nr:hypothetical protein [Colocasia esculenta]